jgi:hypothetical protein
VHTATRRRSLRIAGWLHAGLTAFVVLATANHWVLDVMMGWVVVAAGWTAAGARLRLAVPVRRPGREREAAPLGCRP